jgi:hypothetical protein
MPNTTDAVTFAERYPNAYRVLRDVAGSDLDTRRWRQRSGDTTIATCSDDPAFCLSIAAALAADYLAGEADRSDGDTRPVRDRGRPFVYPATECQVRDPEPVKVWTE